MACLMTPSFGKILIFIGITSAFIYSLSGTLLNLGPDYQFYETAATITSLVLFGNLLEERSVRKTTSAIDDLSKIQPIIAKRVSSSALGDIVSEIDVESIKPGDILLTNNGDQVPTDGEIVTPAPAMFAFVSLSFTVT